MSLEQWTAVDRYFEESLLEPDAVLDAVVESMSEASLPAIAVTPNQGKFLFILAKAIGARRVLEIGTLAGYSTIWLARALPAGGQLVTLELDTRHAEVARRNFARAGITDRIDLRVGRALESLGTLSAERVEPFDLVFIDADKAHLAEYLDWSVRLSRTGGLIIADNVVRDGAVVDPKSADASVQGVRRFMAAVRTDRRVTAAALQTVGGKGYDGFATLLVNRTS